MRSVVLCLVFWVAIFAWGSTWASADEEQDEGEGDDQKDDGKDGDENLNQRVEDLEAKIKAMEDKDYWTGQRIRGMDWDSDREYYRMPNGWAVTWHGLFRTRAIVDANTENAYTNAAGETVYAYNPESTFVNDYGWWDTRLLTWGAINYGDTADLVFKFQFGDWVWGSQSAALGGRGQGKFDDVTLWVRELWVRWRMDPIPLTMEFGRMPWVLGNRIVSGLEIDGAKLYFPHQYFQIGIGGYRGYEGENVEMEMKNNDDEDGFLGWFDITPSKSHKLSAYGLLELYELSEVPGQINPDSPLYELPAFDHPTNNSGQGSDLYTLGVNYVFDAGKHWRVNLEGDGQYGKIKANQDTAGAEDIEFSGIAGFGKVDYRFPREHILSLAGGYGSGDDPETPDFEGFFAPRNDFGIRDELENENIEKGYFHVYEFLSPPAGTPGGLFGDLAVGGIDNTTFAHLMYDTRFQANHHYFFGVGYLQASEPNPVTDDATIGVEFDMRVDYYFSNNMAGSFYGGHLFMLGDYFRKDAHDAATFRWEWRIVW